MPNEVRTTAQTKQEVVVIVKRITHCMDSSNDCQGCVDIADKFLELINSEVLSALKEAEQTLRDDVSSIDKEVTDYARGFKSSSYIAIALIQSIKNRYKL